MYGRNDDDDDDDDATILDVHGIRIWKIYDTTKCSDMFVVGQWWPFVHCWWLVVGVFYIFWLVTIAFLSHHPL